MEKEEENRGKRMMMMEESGRRERRLELQLNLLTVVLFHFHRTAMGYEQCDEGLALLLYNQT